MRDFLAHACALCIVATSPFRALAVTDAAPRLAVLDFDYVAADQDAAHLGKGMQQMLTTDLEKIAGLPMVERGRLRDILKELKLSETPYVDADEAVKIGRLAGATHLVTGSIVIDSGTMRIDMRIVAVETGKVLFAEEVSGERDAFWELEKEIVKLTVDRLGLKPTANERAALSRVHTPRFDNFTAFSQAIDLADQKQYPAAVAVLKRLSETDEDFILAKTTLAEYTQLLQKLEARALALQEQKEQLVLSTASEEARRESVVLEMLAELANRKPADARERVRRCEALYMLARAYSGFEWCDGLREVADHFAAARAATHYTRLYWNEAVELFPEIPPTISSRFGPGGFENLMKAARGPLTIDEARDIRGFCVKPEGYFGDILNGLDLYHLEPFCNHLDVDLPQRIRIIETILTMLEQEKRVVVSDDDDETVFCELLSCLANCYRGNADFAGSTACFTKLALRYKDADRVRQVTKEVELDKRLAEAFANCPDKASAEECARLLWAERYLHRSMNADFLLELVSATPGKDISREGGECGLRGAVRAKRAVRFGYAIEGDTAYSYRMSDVPTWLVRKGDADLFTGPRKGPYTFDALEYFEKTMHPDAARNGHTYAPTFLITGGSRSDKARIEVTFDVRRPGDWKLWKQDKEDFLQAIDLSEDLVAMQVGLMFGVRDVNSLSRKAYPMQGEALLIGKGRVEYSTFRESNEESGKTSHPTPFAWDVVAQQPYDASEHEKHVVALSLEPDGFTAKVNGHPYKFTRKDPEPGFVGLVVQGPGYVRLSELELPADGAATDSEAP